MYLGGHNMYSNSDQHWPHIAINSRTRILSSSSILSPVHLSTSPILYPLYGRIHGAEAIKQIATSMASALRMRLMRTGFFCFYPQKKRKKKKVWISSYSETPHTDLLQVSFV
jgi:hypothetical protein